MRRLMEWRCQGVVGVECERRSLDYLESAHVGHVMRRLGRGRRRQAAGTEGKLCRVNAAWTTLAAAVPGEDGSTLARCKACFPSRWNDDT